MMIGIAITIIRIAVTVMGTEDVSRMTGVADHRQGIRLHAGTLLEPHVVANRGDHQRELLHVALPVVVLRKDGFLDNTIDRHCERSRRYSPDRLCESLQSN